MGNHIVDGSLAILLQESVIDGGLCHTTFLGKGTHLVVGQVTRMIAKRAGRRVTAHNRLTADFERVIETLLASMTHIYQHT